MPHGGLKYGSISNLNKINTCSCLRFLQPLRFFLFFAKSTPPASSPGQSHLLRWPLELPHLTPWATTSSPRSHFLHVQPLPRGARCTDPKIASDGIRVRNPGRLLPLQGSLPSRYQVLGIACVIRGQ